jgi:hypothetical protein
MRPGSGVIDYNINVPELRQSLLQHLLHLPPVSYVRQEGNRLPAQFSDLGSHPFSLLLVSACVHYHVGPISGQRQGNSPANVSAGPGDQGNLSFQAHLACYAPSKNQISCSNSWYCTSRDVIGELQAKLKLGILAPKNQECYFTMK